MPSTTPDVLIIGAGLAGLKLAGDLHAAGRAPRVLDKGRGVGGRAATRRWDACRWTTARSSSPCANPVSRP